MAIDVDKNFKKKRTHRSKSEQSEAVEKMKKALIDGLPCKVASIEGGYGLFGGARFFKKQTGLTMAQFQRRYQRRKS